MTMKMGLKMKNSSKRYDTNRPRASYGQKYSKHKTCLSIMMVICIKQHISNIWGSVHEKVKQHWGWIEKTVAYKKSVYLLSPFLVSSEYFSRFFQTAFLWPFFICLLVKSCLWGFYNLSYPAIFLFDSPLRLQWRYLDDVCRLSKISSCSKNIVVFRHIDQVSMLHFWISSSLHCPKLIWKFQ